MAAVQYEIPQLYLMAHTYPVDVGDVCNVSIQLMIILRCHSYLFYTKVWEGLCYNALSNFLH